MPVWLQIFERRILRMRERDRIRQMVSNQRDSATWVFGEYIYEGV